MLETAQLSPEYTAANEAYDTAGGVVDFAAFIVPDGLTGDALHLQATLQAHETLQHKMRSQPAVLARIPTTEFLGTLQTSMGVFDRLEPFFEARADALATKGGFVGPASDGFLFAFADPPYGLRFSPSEAQRVFDAICEGLFGGFEDDLEILRWSNDWSTYFDMGHEWWGAFWWTVHNRTRQTVIVVAAAQSD
jgi:hypothetical protein